MIDFLKYKIPTKIESFIHNFFLKKKNYRKSFDKV
jgi:hypothetical protein